MYQIVVICTDNRRKKLLEDQFTQIRIRDHANIHYVRVATPENLSLSTSIHPRSQEAICRTQSHLYALELACLASSPPFTVVLEDNVSLRKSQFVNAIEECTRRWDDLVTSCQSNMVSLGYNIDTFDWESTDEKYHTLRCIYGSKVVRSFRKGLQCYIVRKKDIQLIVPKLIHPTYDKLVEYLHRIIGKTYNVDTCLNLILRQSIVYPPLVISHRRPSSNIVQLDDYTHIPPI